MRGSYTMTADRKKILVDFIPETGDREKVGAYENIYRAIFGLIDFEFRRQLSEEHDPDGIDIESAIRLYRDIESEMMDQIGFDLLTDYQDRKRVGKA